MAITLDDDTLYALRLIIRDELKAHVCRLPLTNDEIKDVVVHVEAVRELGKGDLMVGMHEIRDNHLWLCGIRKNTKVAAALFVGAVLTTIAGSVCVGAWAALKIVAKQVFTS